MKVALGNVVLTSLKPIKISGQEDSFSLATGFGLYYECLRFPVIELFFKRFDVCWQEPCLREEIVVFSKVILHGDQILCQQILSCQCVHSRKMICPLITFHFDEEGRYGGSVYEPNVPIFIFINTGSKIRLGSDLVNELVLSVGDVDNKGRISIIRRFLAHKLLVVCSDFSR